MRRPTGVLARPAAWELAVVGVILAGAAVLRIYDLGSLPYGMSGDEANVGLEGERILHDGWVGPYSPYAMGQPAGVLYATAVPLALFGKSVVALRLEPAIAGVLTVAALLVYEHSLVRPGDLRRLDTAFFTMNGVLSVAFFAFVLADSL